MPVEFDIAAWEGLEGELAKEVQAQTEKALQTYSIDQRRVAEDHGIERRVEGGGYGHRQLYELIQNAADAILDWGDSGKIEIILTENALYCANDGKPIDLDGVQAILHSHMSPKKGHHIGHFGIGFKSVLGVTRSPRLLSRSVSFGFSAEWAEEMIRGRVHYEGELPLLRTAKVLLPGDEARRDALLRSLMAWASTVVCLPRDGERQADLPRDIGDFPAEFLLFSPHVTSLNMRSDADGIRRELRREDTPDGIRLTEGASQSSWRVFTTTYDPSEDARKDSDNLRDRESVTLAWAVPVDGRRGRGHFWAFFPTTYETTLSGIVNGPWKTNADRQGLLEGPANEEMLSAVAGLVAEVLPQLYRVSDPGDVLDVLPARDTLQWADEHLADELFALASRSAFLGDCDGEPRRPPELRMIPDGLPEPVVTAWMALRERPTGWAHPRTATRERRPRAIRCGAQEASVTTWLHDIAAPGTVEASLAAIELAGMHAASRPSSAGYEGRGAPIVLTDKGSLAAPQDVFFYAAHDDGEHGGQAFVHPDISADLEARKMLELLGVRELDPLAELKLMAAQLRATRPIDWRRFWEISRRVQLGPLTEFLKLQLIHEPVMVFNLKGGLIPALEAMLPGEIASAEDDATVDVSFHRADTEVLRDVFGLTDVPHPDFIRIDAHVPRGYRQAAEQWYREQPGLPGTPQSGYIVFQRGQGAGPLRPYARLSPDSRERFIDWLLPQASGDGNWLVHHETRAVYPKLAYLSPAQWLISHDGTIPTTQGRVPPHEAWQHCWAGVVGPLLPCAILEIPFLPLRNDLGELTAAEARDALALSLSEGSVEEAWALYARLAPRTQPPRVIRARRGREEVAVAPPEATVTSDRLEFDLLVRSGDIPVMFTDPRMAGPLRSRWGLQEADISKELSHVPAGPEEELEDRFPGLPPAVHASYGSLRLLPCTRLGWLLATADGTQFRPETFVLDSGTCYFSQDAEAFNLLTWLNDQLGWSLTEVVLAECLVDSTEQLRGELVARIAGATGVSAKLAEALPQHTLRRRIPHHVLAEAEHGRPLTGAEAVEILLSLHGSAILKVLRDDLRDVGLDAPSQFAGSARAVRFVRTLGLPDAFAGRPPSAAPPFEEVDGPIDLPPLHEFQETVSTRIRDFLQQAEPGRGLLSLPTGAGKTRVVTESIVREYAEGRLSGAIIWIADREELCEQAVGAWRDAWRAFGPPTRLRISRLWGSNNDRIEDIVERDHVVVSTFQSLARRIDTQNYAWLYAAACVVIDEAHGSVTPSYTKILSALDLTPRETIRPLIGVTATPFRGSNYDPGSETERLVRRYQGNRFDHGVFPDEDEYRYLRDLGVLSRVTFEVLEGTVIALEDKELAELQEFQQIPESVVRRLAEDEERNRRIVQAVLNLNDEWPTLLFALNVDHAELLASMLALRGKKTMAISSKTDRGARREGIAAFRGGDLRVLTNWGVLTTGFDAPKVRAMVVARPVYSPVMYQQIIGRGLRGPLNGGTDSCHIINVADNFDRYEEELAFKQFEHLWRRVGPHDLY